MGASASKLPEVEISRGFFISQPGKKQKRNAAILSFDGGGSRGVMECVILDIIFKMATVIIKNPSYIPCVRSLLNKEIGSKERIKLKQALCNLEPFHPTDAFDMIVGTSTGGLIALGLLAGNVKNGKRITMSVRECIDMYLRNTSEIFGKSAWAWYTPANWWFQLFNTLPYSKGNLEHVLKEIFGDARLKDVDPSCVGGCVAKVVGVKKEKLKFFNNVSILDKDIPIYKVLMATCDAPIYFDGPVEINGQQYVDGGIGGNCPLAQAIPTALELWGKDTNLIVVSLSPPMGVVEKVPTGTWNQIKYWLHYFPNQVTCGGMIYRALKEDFNLGRQSQFYRIAPEGEKLDAFGMDELNVAAMIEATEEFAFSLKGTFEILLVVFAVVSELLVRERKIKDKDGKRNLHIHRKREYNGFLLFLECQQFLYDWLLINGWGLVEILLSAKNVEDKAEKVENLLTGLDKSCEALEIDQIRRDYLTEAKMLRTLGVIYSLNGKQSDARRMFHRLLLTLDSSASADSSRTNHTAGQYRRANGGGGGGGGVGTTKTDRVEAIILYGTTWERNGFFAGERAQDDGPGTERGAVWFFEESLALMTSMATTTTTTSTSESAQADGRVEKLINFCHFKIGRCYMEMGHLETALVHLNRAVKDFPAKSYRNKNRSTPTYAMGDVAVDESLEAARVWHHIGLTHMKLEDMDKAVKALKMAVKLFRSKSTGRDIFADIPLDKLAEIDCLGLLFIAKGEPRLAVNHYGDALGMIRKVMGAKPHLAKSEITSHMALASLKAEYRNESYRYYMSILQIMKQIDDNYVHPLIGKASANLAIIDIHRLDYLEAYDLLTTAHDQFTEIQGGLKEQLSTPELQQIENNMACLLCLMKNHDDADEIIQKARSNCDKFSCPFTRMTEDIHRNADTIAEKRNSHSESRIDEFHFFILV